MSANSLFVLVTLRLILPVDLQDPNMVAVFPYTMEKERLYMQEPCDDPSDRESYDFIIVGAGAAGSVLANRLTEVSDWHVLLLEAGGEETFVMSIPYLIGMYQQSDAGWHYVTEKSNTSCLGAVDQQCDYPSGKCIGGCTSINYMFHVRGNRRDYDRWEELGNPGWGYNTMLEYFKKGEDMQIPELRDSKFHSSSGGNYKVSYAPYQSDLSKTVLTAGTQMGEKIVDYNGENQTGFSRFQSTMTDGMRWSASRAFLHPVRGRMNLHVKKRSLVYEILINETTKTAYGVRYMKGGNNYSAIATKEVIISGGPINSPQLLMLSGIGPKDHLEDFDIPVIKDLKVGYNLMDHVGMIGLVFVLNESVYLDPVSVLSNPSYLLENIVNNSGPLTVPLTLETVSFHELENASYHTPGWPDFEIIHLTGIVTNQLFASAYRMTDEMYEKVWKPIADKPTYMPFPFQLRPKSRGRITLRDKNISSPPLIDPMLLSHEDDVELQIAAIRKAIELGETEAFQKLGAKLHDIPIVGCEEWEFNSDDYWTCALRHVAIPIYHQSGTCKMGPSSDGDAVVDSELKVHGVKKLRVIDASIMPEITSGHLTTPTYAIAEKGADLIKNEYNEL